MSGWSSLSWLCIDSETTGLDPGSDRIVELAAVQFAQGRVLRRMSMLVNPGIPIPPGATSVHGISDADVADAPTLEQIGERFLRHVRVAQVLVGYNWPFDAAFLQAGLGKAWSEAIEGKPVVDALVVVRKDEVGRYWKGPGRHKLEAVAQHLGIGWEGKSHRASSDCVMTCKVLWHLREHLPVDAEEAAMRVMADRAQQERDFQAWQSARRQDRPM